MKFGQSLLLIAASLMLFSACAAPTAGTAAAPLTAEAPATGGASAMEAPSTQPAPLSPPETPAALDSAGASPLATATAELAPALTATAGAADAPAAPASGPYRLGIVPADTQAVFRVKEQLAGRSLPNDAVGTTNAVSGQIVIQPDGTIAPGESKIVVDVSTLQTDERRRDDFIKRNTLETGQFPQATFVPTKVEGLASPLPTSGDVAFQITGDMTVHGVTKQVTWDVKATIAGKDMKGRATQSFKFGDFGMTPPRAMVVLSVEDNIRLELDFHLQQQ
jgi:polyisoprenoid-binding protein YceI